MFKKTDYKVDVKEKHKSDRVYTIKNKLFKNYIYALIIKQNNTVDIVKLSQDTEDFVYNDSLYFVDRTLALKDNKRLLIYFENVSIPVDYRNIEIEKEKVKYTDLDGEVKECIISKIKNLDYDGKALNIFANRKFAKVFADIQEDIFIKIIFIISTISMIVSVATIILLYAFEKGLI